MPTFQVQNSSLTSNVATLTLDSVGALVSGYSLTVEGVGGPYDGTVTLTSVDAATSQVTYSVAHTDVSSADSTGAAILPVDWITIDDVIGFLGLQPSDADDLTYLEDCTAAANDWAFDRRYAASYRDRPQLVPNNRVKLGTVLYASALYRERGSIDSYQSFQGMETPAPVTGSFGQINRLLGLQKPAIS